MLLGLRVESQRLRGTERAPVLHPWPCRGNLRAMARWYVPLLFDSDRFEADAKHEKPDEDEIAALVSKHMLSDEAFAAEKDLVDNLIEGIERARHPARKDALTLLGYVSEGDGRLAGNDPYLGYLLRREVARLKKVLATMKLADAAIEEDRAQLLRVLGVASQRKLGLVYLIKDSRA